MLTNQNTEIILGPPGTGKTTYQLNQLEKLGEKGIPFNQIGFFTFTKKAAEEAKSRAMAKFSVSEKDMPFVRTFHSLGYRQLGLSTKEIMDWKDRRNVANEVGVNISFKRMDEDEIMSSGSEDGDKCLSIMNLSKVRMIPLEESYDQFSDGSVEWDLVKQFHDRWENYKKQNLLLDFNDILYRMLNDGMLPKLQFIFVDEAQDLSTLQWKMVEWMSQYTEKNFLSGDDDQAIYRWGGADVDYWIKVEGNATVLAKSYRVPKAVHDVADELVERIKVRREKDWEPRDEVGVVERYTSLEDVDLSEGSWFILCRNRYLFNKFKLEDLCIRNGYSYNMMGKSLVRDDSLRAVQIWERLRKGNSVRAEQAALVYDYLSANSNTNGKGYRFGFKARLQDLDKDQMVTMKELKENFGLLTDKVWYEGLDRLNDYEKQYFRAALARGEKLSGPPRIKISTIHGVKGGEADNVLLITDISYRSFHNMNDDEHRVFYVGVTRARKSLHILEPQTSYYYDI